MSEEQILILEVPEDLANMRLDQALSSMVAGHSRAQLQQWIKEGRVLLGDRQPKQRDRVAAGDRLEIRVPEPEPADDWQPEPMALDVIYEDDQIMVLNKPAGLVVHPGAGNTNGTLLNALIAHAPGIENLARAGIVHRLDKDTSGLMVVAKTEAARLNLVEQLAEHAVAREYLAVVNGLMVAGGTVDEPMARHPKDRKRMAVVPYGGKDAVTHYRVEEKFRAHTLVRASLETGRTHQIRVHMTYINYPLVGDPVYGGRLKFPKACSESMKDGLRRFSRQALHATRLMLEHPETGEEMSWHVPLPRDMEGLLDVLRADAREHGND